MFLAGFLLCSILLYWFAVPPRMRSPFLLLCSLVFVSLFSPLYAAYYLIVSAIVYVTVPLMKDRARRKRYFFPVLVLLIANICFYKYSRQLFSLADTMLADMAGARLIPAPEIIFPIGLSFVTFRLIHAHVEAYRGSLPDSSFTDFALYVLFFPTFLAGPVERFPVFHAQTTKRPSLKLEEVNYGLWRIVLGVARKFLVADYIRTLIMPILRYPGSYPGGVVILAIYGAAIWLYMDFAGYTDMAIGVSRLFGYRIVENFNRPFFKKNIALYWRNWHISVYSWIRDYFYFPLFVYKGTPVKMYFGIFCTMMVFMLWHEASPNFLIGGIYTSIGLICWNLFQALKRKYAFLRRMVDHSFLDPLATLVTFSYASFGIGIAFSGSALGGIRDIVSKLTGG